MKKAFQKAHHPQTISGGGQMFSVGSRHWKLILYNFTFKTRCSKSFKPRKLKFPFQPFLQLLDLIKTCGMFLGWVCNWGVEHLIPPIEWKVHFPSNCSDVYISIFINKMEVTFLRNSPAYCVPLWEHVYSCTVELQGCLVEKLVL